MQDVSRCNEGDCSMKGCCSSLLGCVRLFNYNIYIARCRN